MPTEQLPPAVEISPPEHPAARFLEELSAQVTIASENKLGEPLAPVISHLKLP